VAKNSISFPPKGSFMQREAHADPSFSMAFKSSVPGNCAIVPSFLLRYARTVKKANLVST
jgi:hypothetical protein